MKLKHSEIKTFREQLLVEQSYRCALCDDTVFPTEAVLDHDHKSGIIRAVLHRGCNSMLGKIENSMPRSQINLERLRKFAVNLVSYIETPHTDITHPTYKTPEEKKMKKKKKGGGRGRGRGR